MLQRCLAWGTTRKRIWTGSGVKCQTWGDLHRHARLTTTGRRRTFRDSWLRSATLCFHDAARGQQYQRTSVHTAAVHARQGVAGHVAVAGKPLLQANTLERTCAGDCEGTRRCLLYYITRLRCWLACVQWRPATSIVPYVVRIALSYFATKHNAGCTWLHTFDDLPGNLAVDVGGHASALLICAAGTRVEPAALPA